MATPSSKQNPGATPTHLTSSPRPSAVPMARPLSHKSPLTRTPSASGQWHGQQPSTSHQYSTPLTATAGIDDPVTFSSPSALLALGGYGGISPSPAGHDGLVGAGMNENDIQALGMQGLKLGPARDSDEERRRHIEDVVQLLRTRVMGRGVCREGVERLVQLEGFESIWQDDNINIAGNFVDLEIEFYPGRNTVKDVSLRYATADFTEGEQREEATAVLKRDLVQPAEEGDRGVWKSLSGFHENLRWLAKLDRLGHEVNCFEAIEGLYECLQRIWHEEGKNRKYSGVYEHLCNGWIGRPRMHKRGRIGLSLDYWVEQGRVLDAKQKKSSPDVMEVDQPSSQLLDDETECQLHLWGVLIECEEGYPSLRVSKEWVNREVLTTVNASELSSSNEAGDSNVTVVNWADPPPTSVNVRHANAMELDTDMLESSPPNRRFVAKIDPPLDVPILAASEMYRQLGIQLPQEYKMVTYDGLLVPGWSPTSVTEGIGLEGTAPIDRRKRRMSVEAFDTDGKSCRKQHSYTFQAFESVAGRTVRDIPFSHPRQLVDIFPTLRQYALLTNMIRKIFGAPTKRSDSRKPEPASKDSSLTKRFPNMKIPGVFKEKDGLVVLSNEDPNEARLNSLLQTFNADGSPESDAMKSSAGDTVGESSTRDDVKVDVTLRAPLGQAPVIMLLFTVNDARTPGESEISNISISFEIGLNGRISVIDTTGLLEEEPDTEKAPELRRKITRVLETSQDIGMLVEWVLRWKRQHNNR